MGKPLSWGRMLLKLNTMSQTSVRQQQVSVTVNKDIMAWQGKHILLCEIHSPLSLLTA